MGNISITNPTILNSETADVTKLTQNDNDLVNGLTDGTKDISISTGKFADGSANAPSVTFSGDSDTGFYRIGANNVGLSIGGTKRIDISTSTADFGSLNIESTGQIGKSPNVIYANGVYGNGQEDYRTNSVSFFTPIYIPTKFSMSAYKIHFRNSTAGVNYDLGFYNTAGTLLTSLGTTSAPASSVTDYYSATFSYTFQPGNYVIGFSKSGCVAVSNLTLAGALIAERLVPFCGIKDNAFPLSSSVDFSVLSSLSTSGDQYFPIVGLISL
jgi:hypothetical protein